MAASSVKRILITGATGKQGGAVIRALLANPPSFEHEILALTRNTSSKSAQSLASSSPRIKLVSGDLENAPAIFESTGGKGSVWAVFLVTLPSMKKLQEGVTDKEIVQGKAVFDAAKENDVKHFVFSSVDRGGDVKSWDNPTPIPHFITKHQIELHIRDNINPSQMTYTILRPVAFMDNYMPGMPGRIFAAAWAQVGDKKLQFVAVKDIGIIAAKALCAPDSDEYKNQAIGLAGDDLTEAEGSDAFWRAKGRPIVQSYWVFAYIFKWLMADLGIMFKWFESNGYGVDIEKCKKLNPEMLDFETWLKKESKHV